MRRYLAGLVLGAAAAAGAQAPAGPTPPASAAPRSSNVEFRVGGIMISGDRSYEFLGDVRSTTGSIQGVDFLFRGKAAGVSFRSMTGTFGDQPHVTSADARLLLFPQVFSIVAGVGRRALWSELNAATPTQFDVGIAGISSTVRIGGSGLRTNISASVYLPAGETSDRIKGGMEGEASLIYTLPRVPLFVQLGYRTEVFTSKNNDFEVPEEVRGIRLGGGLQLGGR
jgi:hypothetical protein